MRVWAPPRVFQHQPDALLNQPAPVQNTWYTLLDTTRDVRLYSVAVMVEAATETIEVRITVDGVVMAGNANQNAGIWYSWFRRLRNDILGGISSDAVFMFSTFLEGRTVKIEVRKTTAAGAGILHGRAIYAKL